MNSKDFYQYWHYIETRAFLPTDKKVKGWLRNFELFFNKIFEVGDKFPLIRKESNRIIHKIEFKSLDITCEYQIETDFSKFSFFIDWKSAALQFEYDSQYICEFDYLDKHCSEISNNFSKRELEEVLKSKIWHPALHYHIKGKVIDETQEKEIDFPHDIRIGTAVKNPLLFLYQLSFQFLCILGESKKRREFERLVTVIFENKNEDKIPSDILFGKR
ncbi:MAG: hypothetical protein GTO45_04485 [Candidatus Aminicenantes bacterium]|nr:hypothetical protein [Candidatus Aminicenantes bacterium]NIM78007.1 hypothetical protein [Candidatus Aminicenantes bacterium]NIN17329.1 hypothetical protein [Candidatus Aminicenantes bacterium]NIN41221.1 hypothetical protein [Candidatus Aminicenantes bacterium]NIN83995.1 hypothetical protein [Candidatus Aminicenantes bacterium]